MNFLAHLFLAGDNPNSVIGNFIADHVKGRDIFNFPDEIIRGIRMHREIDQFTDHHPIVKKSILRLRPVYRKYSGVIVDMFYDHYLARDWKDFSNISLHDFTLNRYKLLFQHAEIFPSRSRRILFYMADQNWLKAYAHPDGLQKAFTGMSRRTTFVSRMENAVGDLLKCYECYEEEFRLFFPELQSYVLQEFGSFTQE